MCIYNNCTHHEEKTKESINNKLLPRNIELNDVYIDTTKSYNFRCLICGYEWVTSFSNIYYKNSTCKKCQCRSLDSINDELLLRNIKIIDNYTTTKKPALFKCLACGYEWTAKVTHILHDKKGCRQCFITKNWWTKESINDELYLRNIEMIGECSNIGHHSDFKCLTCGYEWDNVVNRVLNHKNGCPACAKRGFNPKLPGILYYIKFNFNNSFYYKIGITNFSVEKRFKKESVDMDIMWTEYFDCGKDAFIKEQLILKEYNEYKYNGPKLLKTGGNTEIFIKDIFNLS